MKLVRFLHKNVVCSGALEGEAILPEGAKDASENIPLQDVKLLAPVKPSKVVLVGLNYLDHAKELGMEIPEEPIIFIKPPTTVIGPGEDIIYPASSSRVDYEAELAVVIKDEIRNIKQAEAEEHILGYTCLNDVTARDLQKKDVQWARAKSFDTFSPVGPWIETELDPADIAVRSFLNDELRQDSRTSEFIFSISYLIEFISGVMTMYPGDIISTGTPHNVGPMNPGDKITIEIEGIGLLTNSIVL